MAIIIVRELTCGPVSIPLKSMAAPGQGPVVAGVVVAGIASVLESVSDTRRGSCRSEARLCEF